jgi:eukaryotic-like serine/threonine-protein kinase
VQIHDFGLERPLASAINYQVFSATDKQGQAVRLIRFLESATTQMTRVQTSRWLSDCRHHIRRSILVSNSNVLPITIVDDDEFTIVATTPFWHRQTLQDYQRMLGNEESLVRELVKGVASAHQMGVAHGRLSTSTVYCMHGEQVSNMSNPRIAIDLLDGLLTSQDKYSTRVDATTFAEDVRQCGMVIQSIVKRTNLDDRFDGEGEIENLIQSMIQPDWTTRPSMQEVLENVQSWQPSLAGNSHPSIPESIRNSLTNDATLAIDLPNVESLALERMVPFSMPEIGRFSIERSLGEGGMGAVFLGRDRSNDQQVAIKVLTQRLAQDEKASSRFAKEARLLSTVDHPSIARLIEFNRDGDTMYIAMEYVPGGCLADFTHANCPMNEHLVIAAIADAARGLGVAHSNGMVHRDIKPANLLLSARGQRSFQSGTVDGTCAEPLIKVADFGLAKHFDISESMAMTQTGMILGTPLYMAPEQCRGETVGAETDVYALGVTLFQCLTGRIPFNGQSPIEIFRKHCDSPVPSMQSIVGGISEPIQHVVEKCLAKNPMARYRDAGELLTDLEGLLSGTPTSIVLHPVIQESNAKGQLRYQFQWKLQSSAESLWPYVSNTDRVNHAIGLPAVRYKSFHDPKLGMRRMATVRAMGMTMEWEEHPYEWIEGRRLSVLRQFPSGPFFWFTNVVELNPQSDGGTLVVQTIEMLPRNLMGKLFAKFQIGAKSERNFGRVYEKVDEYLRTNSKTEPIENPFAKSKSMTREQKRRLTERFDRVKSAGANVDPKVIETLEQYIEHASDLEVARLRPIAFAERFGLKSDDVVHACLLAAREGVFVLLWDILCPTCRIPSDVQETLKGLADHGHCEACNADYELDFAQSIELVFRTHPEVRASETRTYCVGGPAFSPHVVAQIRLQADERITLQLRLSDGQYRLRGPQLPYVIDFRVAPSGRVGRWDIDLSQPMAKQDIPTLRSGEQFLSLLNSLSDPRQIRIERLASRADALTAADAARLPSFREWFPDEVLSPGQMLSLTTVTLLGCQIDQAGKIYDAMADQLACSQILKHLHAMAKIVTAHSGCIVKTKNDGLNTVFPNVLNALRAACEMAEASLQWGVAIRQAMHQGSAIVATINDRLDYFGQTPQTLEALLDEAGPNELWMSEPCWNESNLSERMGDGDKMEMIPHGKAIWYRIGLPLS